MAWMSAIVTPTKRRGVLNYYISRWRQEVSLVWRPDPLVTRCSRESKQSGPPGPRLSSPGERERNTVMANRVRVNMLQFCSVSNYLSHTTFQIKWEVYFSKNCVARLNCVVCMHPHMRIQHWKPEQSCCLSDFIKKSLAYVCVKNSQDVK